MLYALSIEQKHSEKLPYQCVQSANIRLISCCAHTLCHQYIIIIYTRYTNVQCTWILKSNYPCTFKITLQKHSNSCYRIACTHSIFYLYRWLYAAAYAYVFCLYIYNYLCDEHKTSPLSHLNRNPILVVHAVCELNAWHYCQA